MIVFPVSLSLYIQQEKPKLIDPLDYEAVITELEPELKEDPLQDLLLFPDHDFTVSSSVCVNMIKFTLATNKLLIASKQLH